MKAGSWTSIVSLFLIGVLCAASVSKLIPFSAEMTQHFGTTPTQFGWLISLIALPSVLLAIPSGVLVDRYGPMRVIFAAVAVGAAANFVYLIAPSLTVLHIARVLEGAAICHVYTAVPAFLMATTDGKRRATAMTLWATYMPIGTAVGLLLASHFVGATNWRMAYAIHGALFLLVALLNLRQPGLPDPALGAPRPTLVQRLADLRGTYSRPALLLFALAFFLMISLGFGANSTFPSYFARIHNVPLAQSSSVLAFGTLLMIPGSLGVGALVAAGLRQATVFTAIGIIGLLAGSLAFYPHLDVPARAVVVAIWFVVSGASISTLMATLPLVAEPARRGAAAALLNLSAASATFVNPPLWLPLSLGGWLPFAGLMSVGWLVAVASVWGLTAFHAREKAK
jgi:predicted MFS family arabinose efflux permease